MHGVRRDRTQQTAEWVAQKKERDSKKLQQYLQVESRFFSFRSKQVVTQEALDATSELLLLNPEMYTAWNYRRTVLESMFGQDEEEARKGAYASDHDYERKSVSDQAHELTSTSLKQVLLQEDIELTMQVLLMHPKVYWIWNHRKWCLQHLPSQDTSGLDKWHNEIGMVSKMLERDARNCGLYKVEDCPSTY